MQQCQVEIEQAPWEWDQRLDVQLDDVLDQKCQGMPIVFRDVALGWDLEEEAA
jgi:hypothetical protein